MNHVHRLLGFAAGLLTAATLWALCTGSIWILVFAPLGLACIALSFYLQPPYEPVTRLTEADKDRDIGEPDLSWSTFMSPEVRQQRIEAAGRRAMEKNFGLGGGKCPSCRDPRSYTPEDGCRQCGYKKLPPLDLGRQPPAYLVPMPVVTATGEGTPLPASGVGGEPAGDPDAGETFAADRRMVVCPKCDGHRWQFKQKPGSAVVQGSEACDRCQGRGEIEEPLS